MINKSIKDFKFLEGLKLKEGQNKTEEPYFIHPNSIDGESIMRTCDMNFHRINVIVEKGIITEVKDFG